MYYKVFEKSFTKITLLMPLVTFIIGLIALKNAPLLDLNLTIKDGKHILSSNENAELMHVGEMELKLYDLMDDFDQIEGKEDFFHFLAFQRYISKYIQKDTNISITLLENGMSKSVFVVPKEFPISYLLMEFPLFLAAFFCIVIAFLLERKKNDIRIKVFTILLYVTSTIFISYAFWSLRNLSLDPFSTLFFICINSFSFIYFPLLFLHFFLIFPKKRAFSIKKKFIILFYTLPIFIAPIFLFRIFYEIQQLLFLFGVGGGIVVMIWSFFSASAIEKAQLKWILWGSMVFSLIMLLTYILPTLGVFSEFYSYQIPAVAFILLPITIAFAISKYRLMDIDILIDNTLIYAFTYFILIIMDFMVIYMIDKFTIEVFSSSLKSFIALWLVIILYSPLRNFLTKVVKKVFKRDNYNSDELALSLAKSIIPLDNVQMVLDKAFQTIYSTLHPIDSMTVLFNKDLKYSKLSNEFIFLRENITLTFNAPKHLFKEYKNSSLPKKYISGVIAPIIANSGRIGFLLFANKQSEQLYTKKDLNLIEIVTSQIAIAIESIRAKEIIKANKEQIIQEIHDGIGGIVTNISLISEMSKENSSLVELKNNTETIAELSKDAIFEIRTILQSIDISNSSYKEFSFTLQRYAKTMLEPHNIFFLLDESIETNVQPPNAVVTLNIFRIYREALTNILKHSQSKQVRTILNVTKESIELSIKDNGIGLKIKNKGRGIANMQKRAKAMGAKLEIKDENGTEILLKIYFHDTRYN